MTTNDQPQTIPADKVRAARDLHRDAAKMVTITDAEREIHQHVADAMEALLPPRPTLADMTPEERAKCQRMQADTEKRGRAIITDHDWWDGHADLIDRQGKSFRAAHDTITPRPDLPRFEWPGEQRPAPAAPALPAGWRLADHEKHGRVIVTTTPDEDGEVCFMFPADDLLGYDWEACRPDELTYIDQEATND